MTSGRPIEQQKRSVMRRRVKGTGAIKSWLSDIAKKRERRQTEAGLASARTFDWNDSGSFADVGENGHDTLSVPCVSQTQEHDDETASVYQFW